MYQSAIGFKRFGNEKIFFTLLYGIFYHPASTHIYSIHRHDALPICAWVGGRLPTAREWRAEASAGGTRTYPWGNEAPDCTRANYAAQAGPCQNDTLTPPCALPAGNSVSGLCDMAGNAGEIIEDSSGGSVRLAGGSIDTGSAGLRADGEVQRPDSVGTGFAGFRCVKDPQ